MKQQKNLQYPKSRFTSAYNIITLTNPSVLVDINNPLSKGYQATAVTNFLWHLEFHYFLFRIYSGLDIIFDEHFSNRLCSFLSKTVRSNNLILPILSPESNLLMKYKIQLQFILRSIDLDTTHIILIFNHQLSFSKW